MRILPVLLSLTGACVLSSTLAAFAGAPDRIDGQWLLAQTAPATAPSPPVPPMMHGGMHGQTQMPMAGDCPMMHGQMGAMPGPMGACPMMGGAATTIKVPYGGNQQAAAAYNDASMKMHSAMDIAYSGNPDRDFAAAMIPHHQGAVDMAKVALEHAVDPEIRKLAQEIIDAQEKELAFIKAWFAKHPQ